MTPDPFLAKVTLRAWGTDDPRVLKHLRTENDPAGLTFRYKTVRARAIDAGYPVPTVVEANRAAGRALGQLVGAEFHWNGTRHHDWLFRSRHNQIDQLGENASSAEDYAAEDGPLTVFDE